jgi:hypothetical protein
LLLGTIAYYFQKVPIVHKMAWLPYDPRTPNCIRMTPFTPYVAFTFP